MSQSADDGEHGAGSEQEEYNLISPLAPSSHHKRSFFLTSFGRLSRHVHRQSFKSSTHSGVSSPPLLSKRRSFFGVLVPTIRKKRMMSAGELSRHEFFDEHNGHMPIEEGDTIPIEAAEMSRPTSVSEDNEQPASDLSLTLNTRRQSCDISHHRLMMPIPVPLPRSTTLGSLPRVHGEISNAHEKSKPTPRRSLGTPSTKAPAQTPSTLPFTLNHRTLKTESKRSSSLSDAGPSKVSPFHCPSLEISGPAISASLGRDVKTFTSLHKKSTPGSAKDKSPPKSILKGSSNGKPSLFQEKDGFSRKDSTSSKDSGFANCGSCQESSNASVPVSQNSFPEHKRRISHSVVPVSSRPPPPTNYSARYRGYYQPNPAEHFHFNPRTYVPANGGTLPQSSSIGLGQNRRSRIPTPVESAGRSITFASPIRTSPQRDGDSLSFVSDSKIAHKASSSNSTLNTSTSTGTLKTLSSKGGSKALRHTKAAVARARDVHDQEYLDESEKESTTSAQEQYLADIHATSQVNTDSDNSIQNHYHSAVDRTTIEGAFDSAEHLGRDFSDHAWPRVSMNNGAISPLESAEGESELGDFIERALGSGALTSGQLMSLISNNHSSSVQNNPSSIAGRRIFGSPTPPDFDRQNAQLNAQNVVSPAPNPLAENNPPPEFAGSVCDDENDNPCLIKTAMPIGYWIGRFNGKSDQLRTQELPARAAAVSGAGDPGDTRHPANTGIFDDATREKVVMEQLEASCGTREAKESFEAFKRSFEEKKKNSGVLQKPKAKGSAIFKRFGEGLRRKSKG